MAPSTYRKLQDKHVIVIGGSSGIGYAVADGALASGAKVTISSSSKDKLDKAVSQLGSEYPDGPSIQGIAVDLSNPETIEADLDSLFSKAQSAQGTINHVVYTASEPPFIGGLDAITPAIIHQASQMRFVVPLILGKVAARYLPKTTNSSIVLTSGSVYQKPSPGWSLISYFGGGLISLAKGLSVDLTPVRVNIVTPGFVETPLWSAEAKAYMDSVIKDKLLTGKFGQPADVAEAYLWLMKDENVTGFSAGTDGGQLLV